MKARQLRTCGEQRVVQINLDTDSLHTAQCVCRAFPLTEDFLGSFKGFLCQNHQILLLIKGLILMWSVQTYRKITHWRFTAGQEKLCKGKYIFVFVCVYVCVCVAFTDITSSKPRHSPPMHGPDLQSLHWCTKRERKKERKNKLLLAHLLPVQH